ncbi:cofactor-independent phosphoglycerate mutase [Alkalitalea saponilacus]|uniref:2,3-bisphosphoglycerate-independent phosphoglycerate mutase n=1 Tax=Alkalitalea saponilacus TaxID=889453 RepID=A0A1T5DAN7_9BACT|nr:cofactor-independent phosphoglycerate mutase [Alkalitalea saponilacus]ASB50638.1 cofactor-independent phosphoglycerate mutase [Alkalitalea saponilacus]SKB68593.1 2,3-bisphosphoglycerate-independent phosphoglycerate mutase [Alkalitalea saponilacus]
MKYIVVLADGMADEPIEAFNGLTPAMAAHKPVMDAMCKQAATGLVHTVPQGFHPGSEIANMNILGYQPSKYFEGRGVLEAAALGIESEPDELVFRCNLVSVEENILINHSAGHISTAEADEIIQTLNSELGSEKIKFYTGTSYRHILVIKGANKNVKCTPPHDHPGKPAHPLFPTAESPDADDTAKLLSELMDKSLKILANHPVNVKRRADGKKCADSIWPWSPGYRPAFPSFKERFGMDSGAVISAVDLIHGIGKLAGLESVFVEGATGLHDTNYEGKAAGALDALQKHPFVFLHVEAMDEAGHEGDYQLKKRVIEDFDSRLLKPLWDGLNKMGEPFTFLLLPDHPTPCNLRTHTMEPVPFFMIKPGLDADSVDSFNEETVKNGSLGEILGENILDMFFK